MGGGCGVSTGAVCGWNCSGVDGAPPPCILPSPLVCDGSPNGGLLAGGSISASLQSAFIYKCMRVTFHEEKGAS